jgi:hypothetical protein
LIGVRPLPDANSHWGNGSVGRLLNEIAHQGFRSFIRSRRRLGAGTSGVRLRVQAPCSDGDRARPRLMNHDASLYSPDLL